MAAELPRPLRYAAVAAVGGRVLIAGGTSGTTARREVLRFDPRTRRVRRIGRLPQAAHPRGRRGARRALLRARRARRRPRLPARDDPGRRPGERPRRRARAGCPTRCRTCRAGSFPAITLVVGGRDRAGPGARRDLVAEAAAMRRLARRSRSRSLRLAGCGGGGSGAGAARRPRRRAAPARRPPARRRRRTRASCSVPRAGRIPRLLEPPRRLRRRAPGPAEPGRPPRPGARLRPELAVGHGRRHLPADASRSSTTSPSARLPQHVTPVVGPQDAVGDQRPGQQPDADRPAHRAGTAARCRSPTPTTSTSPPTGGARSWSPRRLRGSTSARRTR